MTTEEKDGAVGDEYLDRSKNPMIKLDPGVDADEEKDVEPYRAPFGDMGPEDSEIEAAVLHFLGPGDESIEILAAPGLPLSRSYDGTIELNGRPLDAATVAERRALTDAAQAKQKDVAEAMTVEDAVDPAKNPMIRVEEG